MTSRIASWIACQRSVRSRAIVCCLITCVKPVNAITPITATIAIATSSSINVNPRVERMRMLNPAGRRRRGDDHCGGRNPGGAGGSISAETLCTTRFGSACNDTDTSTRCRFLTPVSWTLIAQRHF